MLPVKVGIGNPSIADLLCPYAFHFSFSYLNPHSKPKAPLPLKNKEPSALALIAMLGSIITKKGVYGIGILKMPIGI